MTTPKNDAKKKKITRAAVERTIYLILIAALSIYGFKNSEAAVSLINAIKDAFLILFNKTL